MAKLSYRQKCPRLKRPWPKCPTFDLPNMYNAVDMNCMLLKGILGNNSNKDGIYRLSSRSTFSATEPNKKNIASIS